MFATEDDFVEIVSESPTSASKLLTGSQRDAVWERNRVVVPPLDASMSQSLDWGLSQDNSLTADVGTAPQSSTSAQAGGTTVVSGRNAVMCCV